MAKLTKAQEKRFDEILYEITSRGLGNSSASYRELKQHLADELSIQKKEIIEKLEEKRVLSFKVNGQEGQMEKEIKYQINKTLDQAIKTIKGR